MTIPVLMTSPTVMMEEKLFQVLEGFRGVNLESDCTAPLSEGTVLAMRVAVVAHGVLQLAYAVLAVVPVCIATAISVFRQGCITGFSGSSEDAFVRLIIAVEMAAKTLFCPVVNSLKLIDNIRSLHERESGIPEMISGPLTLSLLTMPLITELDQGLPSHETIENRIMNDPDYKASADKILQSVSSTQDGSTSLAVALDRDTFSWRYEVLDELNEKMKIEASSFHKILYPTQEQLQDAIVMAIYKYGRQLAGEGGPSSLGTDGGMS